MIKTDPSVFSNTLLLKIIANYAELCENDARIRSNYM